MGRPLPRLPMQVAEAGVLPVAMVVVSALLVFSAVIFLCGSHSSRKQKTVRLGGENKKRGMEKMKSSLSSKALLMSKMISWRKVQDNGEEEEDEDGVVWKKTIIKGEKCRPLEFSGKILYDSDGNLLPD